MLSKAETQLDLFRSRRDYDSALRSAKAMKVMVASSNSSASEANRLTAQGECYTELGKGDEARRYLVRALQTQRECVDALIVLAELNIKQGIWPLPAAKLRASRLTGVASRTLAEVQAALALVCCEKNYKTKGEVVMEDESVQKSTIQQPTTEPGIASKSTDNVDSLIDSPVLSSIASAATASATLGFSVVDSVELLSRARDLIFTSLKTSSNRLFQNEPHRLFIRVRGMALLSILSEMGYLPLVDDILITKNYNDPSFTAELSSCGKSLLLSIAATDVLLQLVTSYSGISVQTTQSQRTNKLVDKVLTIASCLSNSVHASLVCKDPDDFVPCTIISSVFLNTPTFFSNESQQKRTLIDWKQFDAKVTSTCISRIIHLSQTLRQLGDHSSALLCASSCLDFEGHFFSALQPKDKKCLVESIISLLASDDAGVGLQDTFFSKEISSILPPWMWCVGGTGSLGTQGLIGGGNWLIKSGQSTSQSQIPTISKLLPFLGPIVHLAALSYTASNHFLRFRQGYCIFRKVEEENTVMKSQTMTQPVTLSNIFSQKEVKQVARRAMHGLQQALTVQPVSADFGSTWRLLAFSNALLSAWLSPSSFSVMATSENEWKSRSVQLSAYNGEAIIRPYCISAGIANRQAVALVETLISSIATVCSQQTSSSSSQARATQPVRSQSEAENDLSDISGFISESFSTPLSPSSITTFENIETASKRLHVDDCTLLTLAAHSSLFHANNPGTAVFFSSRAVLSSLRDVQTFASAEEETRVSSTVQTWCRDLLSRSHSQRDINEGLSPNSDLIENYSMLFSGQSFMIEPSDASRLTSSFLSESRKEKHISAHYILALSLLASARAISGNDSTGGSSCGAVIGGGSACGGSDIATSSKRMLKKSYRILCNLMKMNAPISLTPLSQNEENSLDFLESLSNKHWHVAYLLGLVSLHQGDASASLCAARKAISLSTAYGDLISSLALKHSSASVTSGANLQSVLEPALSLPWALAACAASLVPSNNGSSTSKTAVLVLGGLKMHPNDCLLRLIEALVAERLLSERNNSYQLGEIPTSHPTFLAGGSQEVLSSMRSVAQACDQLAWRFIEACAVQSTPNFEGDSSKLSKKSVLSFGSPDAHGTPSPPAPYLIKLAVCAHLHVSRLCASLKLFSSSHAALVKADSLVDATSLSLRPAGSVNLESPRFYAGGVDPVLRADVIHGVGILHEAAAGFVVSASSLNQDQSSQSQTSSFSGSQLSSSLSASSTPLAPSSTLSRFADSSAVIALGGYSQAEAQYAAAVAIAPNHVASLVRLAEIAVISAILYSSGKSLENHKAARKVSLAPVSLSCKDILFRDLDIVDGPEVDTVEMLLARAEGFVTSALRIDDTCADAWSVSSRVFAAQGQTKKSSEAIIKAIDSRQRQIILPIGMLPLLGKNFF